MKRLDMAKLCFVNVLTSPVRSLLTVLGIGVGIGAILAVLTLGDAGKTQVESEMLRLGIDRVWLTAKEGSRLTHGDAALIKKELDVSATEQVYCPVEAYCGARRADALLVGCERGYVKLMDTKALFGRELVPLEWRRGSRTVLLGRETARALGITRESDLETKRVAIGGQLFTACAVVTQQNQLSQIDADNGIFMPLEVLCELMGGAIYEITVAVPPRTKPEEVAAMSKELLESGRGLDVQAITMQVQFEAATSVVNVFVSVLRWVAAICILVGGIGVMNILLVSVRERRREIGIMKSMGASERQICALFLLEALLYAFMGGALGVVTGLIIIAIASEVIGLTASVRGYDIAWVVAAAVCVGLFFGVAPALRASSMTPVDALRE